MNLNLALVTKEKTLHGSKMLNTASTLCLDTFFFIVMTPVDAVFNVLGSWRVPFVRQTVACAGDASLKPN